MYTFNHYCMCVSIHLFGMWCGQIKVQSVPISAHINTVHIDAFVCLLLSPCLFPCRRLPWQFSRSCLL